MERFIPVLIFGRKEKVPEFILYLGKVVPYTAMGLLILFRKILLKLEK